MNIKETADPKISAQETDKLHALSETFRGEQSEGTASAEEKILQRLGEQREADGPQLKSDSEVNGGKSAEYGMMYCSDRCIRSRVSSGRCFHS